MGCTINAVDNKSSMSGHNKRKPVSACNDVSQPAHIRCATAVSSVFDSSGRLWSTWAYAGHVYINYSDDYGASHSSPLVVNRVPEKISARGENRPKIAIAENANIYISWTMPLEKRFTGHIRFSYSTDQGDTFSDPVIINDNLDITGHRFEALGVNKNGDIYIAWLDKRDRLKSSAKNQPYHGAAVYYTWSDNAGVSFKKNKKIIDHSCECCRVIMDFDEQNLPVILWRNIYGKNIRDHALVNFTSKDEHSAPQRVSFDMWKVDACPHHGPDLSINRSGDYHMVWFNNAELRHGLFYSRRNQSDKTMTEAVQFGDYDKMASHPSVIHSMNNVWLAWKQFDGVKESIWYQMSSDNGSHWNAAQQLRDTSRTSDYPFLIKQNENIYVQWQTEAEGFQLMRIN